MDYDAYGDFTLVFEERDRFESGYLTGIYQRLEVTVEYTSCRGDADYKVQDIAVMGLKGDDGEWKQVRLLDCLDAEHREIVSHFDADDRRRIEDRLSQALDNDGVARPVHGVSAGRSYAHAAY